MTQNYLFFFTVEILYIYYLFKVERYSGHINRCLAIMLYQLYI